MVSRARGGENKLGAEPHHVFKGKKWNENAVGTKRKTGALCSSPGATEARSKGQRGNFERVGAYPKGGKGGVSCLT